MSPNASSTRIGFFDRLRTGWTLTKDSVVVIREHPQLLLFPLLAGIASAVFLLVLFIPILVANLIGSGLEYVALFVVYFLTTFSSTYVTAALVYGTNEAFHGREPAVLDCLKAVGDRVGPILVWSLISATVSVVLRSIEDSNGVLASIATSFFAVAWSILTFFIVPVIVFEDVSVTSMFSRSGRAFRETWGESIGAGFGISLIVALVGILLGVGALMLSVPVAAVFPGPGLLLTIVFVGGVIVFTYVLSQTIWGVAKTALYVYAVEGRRPAEFENFDFGTLGGRTERPGTPGAVDTRDTLTQ